MLILSTITDRIAMQHFCINHSLIIEIFQQSYSFIPYHLLTTHLGRQDSTKGLCFTSRDNMHRIRRNLYDKNHHM